MSVDIIEADLARPEHQAAVVEMVDMYSRDPLAGGAPLDPDVRANLAAALRQHPTTLIFLAVDGATPVGVAVCFLGFSTFRAKPLVNIHDLGVVPERRGEGIGARLLAAVEAKARALGCCRLTLEVYENNHAARRVYARAGFGDASYKAEAGGALFLARAL